MHFSVGEVRNGDHAALLPAVETSVCKRPFNDVNHSTIRFQQSHLAMRNDKINWRGHGRGFMTGSCQSSPAAEAHVGWFSAQAQ